MLPASRRVESAAPGKRGPDPSPGFGEWSVVLLLEVAVLALVVAAIPYAIALHQVGWLRDDWPS
jgi:hypothetical protein